LSARANPVQLAGADWLEDRPWLTPHAQNPASADPPLTPMRRRPLIYIYDLPSDFNTRLLQVRRTATCRSDNLKGLVVGVVCVSQGRCILHLGRQFWRANMDAADFLATLTA